MATWQQFAHEAPELAADVRARFEAAKSHVLASLRKDGSPRVSGTEVTFSGPDLWIGSMLHAVKARDLIRDGRCALHAHPQDAAEPGDAKVAGTAVEVVGEQREGYLTGAEPPGDFHLFLIDLHEAVVTGVDGDELVIRVWRPGQGVRTVRRR
ncbi:pyridoxamine 5'-phosphate oxidase family protein [Actinacidiphila guanduensis]|jgi:hypothetical protein|uniref:Pyridoxamine 5'-phosphate oxidase n=1 Tax=Actinacidiphila guanduensis TaxID=310781 RepID=A0A1H0L637_9ACTN|nr:pyridoxamine 5'-phosphate oxidase family protein [Actinacidiphila guanduensis]SDO63709.1 Pyridoxamine 5'-phosphate oxidase [Actinacidiphila guanduensis]